MEIGYKRIKLIPNEEGRFFYKFYREGVELVQHELDIRECCFDSKLIKYLDASGYYRFYPFNQNWEKNINTSSLGEVSKLVTSILESQSDTDEIGKEVKSTISLTATNVQPDDLDFLADLYTSPSVYLYNGTGGDEIKDWIKVQVTGGGIVRRRKQIPQNVDLTIKLPKTYAVTKI